MTNNTIYFFEPNNKNSKKIVSDLENVFDGIGIKTVKNCNDASIVASIGGDGAFLQAVRKNDFRSDCMYIGIGIEEKNYMYVDFNYHNLSEISQVFKLNNFETRSYPVIEVKVNNNQPNYCLNEFTLRSSLVRTIKMDLYIEDFLFEHFNGDGIVISTPTGSTGYNKSLGGAVVDPLINAMQVTELGSVNNNNHRTLGTSFLLSKERPITLVIDQSDDYYPIMSMDNEALSVQNTEKVSVKLSDKKINTIRLYNNTFWHKAQRNFL